MAGGAGSRAERTRARGEIAAVLATGALFLLFEEVLRQKALFIGLAIAFWGAYVLRRARAEPGTWKAWGFGRDGLRPSAHAAIAILAAGAGLAALAGALRGTLRLHWHVLPLLALYPVWGLTQHFMLQALVARNLDRLGTPRPVLVATTAALFALAHVPDPVLVTATFLLAAAFTPVYLRWKNLWPLGIVHGWLGALAYFRMLGRDPVEELIQQLC